MKFSFQALPARLVARPNRFVVVAALDDTGETVRAHCADPGRMRELLLANSRVYLSKSQDSSRKTAYDLHFVEHPASGQLVSVDSRLPNRVFAEALREGAIAPFADYSTVFSEVSVPSRVTERGQTRSRIDFLLENRDSAQAWVEVKSVTLVENRVALFPDAPTERGRRHLLELARLVQRYSARAAAVFMVQRPDADLFRPNRATDPAFADALASVAQQGVEIYAYACTLSVEEIRVDRPIAVALFEAD